MAKKAKAARKPRKKKVPTEQKYIDGFEPPRIRELDKLALEYRDTRDARAKLNLEEQELKEKLDVLMRKHELTVYPIPDTDLEVAIVVTDETVKVRKRSKPQNPDTAAE